MTLLEHEGHPMNREGTSKTPWSVILAGGDGERTRPFIERWLGYHKPKQYCTFSGTRSLFQQTVDRADTMSPAGRRIAVVSRDFAEEARRQLSHRHPGILLAQPSNRGTAAGVLLALAHIQAEDPGGLVILYPSDHFVRPEDGFLRTVRDAVRGVAHHPERLVLVGVAPDGLELDYGWILPGAPLDLGDGRLKRVKAFVEKPSRDEGQALLANGGLWNSMVVVGRVRTFWKLARRHMPRVMSRYRLLRDSVGAPDEASVMDSVYKSMPRRDFSRDLLQKTPDALAVLPLEGVLWSDWGRPERIATTLRCVGAEPAFREEHLLAG